MTVQLLTLYTPILSATVHSVTDRQTDRRHYDANGRIAENWRPTRLRTHTTWRRERTLADWSLKVSRVQFIVVTHRQFTLSPSLGSLCCQPATQPAWPVPVPSKQRPVINGKCST